MSLVILKDSIAVYYLQGRLKSHHGLLSITLRVSVSISKIGTDLLTIGAHQIKRVMIEVHAKETRRALDHGFLIK